MTRRSITTAAAAAVLSAGLVFAGSGAAFAHECYVVKRSAQGTASASHSGNWFQLTLAEAQVQGLPDSFAIFGKFTIPKGNIPERLITDAKGVDSFFAWYMDQLVAIYMEALTR